MTGTVGSGDRWDVAIGRGVRTTWHWVGVYLAVEAVGTALAEAVVVGAVPRVWSVSAGWLATVGGTFALAVLLTLRRPEVSSARTLAFGVLARALFVLLLALFGEASVALSGRPFVGLDIALAGVAAVALAAAAALWLDLEGLGGSRHREDGGESARRD